MPPLPSVYCESNLPEGFVWVQENTKRVPAIYREKYGEPFVVLFSHGNATGIQNHESIEKEFKAF